MLLVRATSLLFLFLFILMAGPANPQSPSVVCNEFNLTALPILSGKVSALALKEELDLTGEQLTAVAEVENRFSQAVKAYFRKAVEGNSALLVPSTASEFISGCRREADQAIDTILTEAQREKRQQGAIQASNALNNPVERGRQILQGNRKGLAHIEDLERLNSDLYLSLRDLHAAHEAHAPRAHIARLLARYDVLAEKVSSKHREIRDCTSPSESAQLIVLGLIR